MASSTEINTTSATNPNLPPADPNAAPWQPSNGVWETYDLHCHCGTIRYKMTVSPPLYSQDPSSFSPSNPDPKQYLVTLCTCSHCQRQGYQAVHPLVKNVEYTHGLSHRSEYRFASKQNPHYFCDRCGSVVATNLQGVNEMMGLKGEEERCVVNVRMLKDYDESKLRFKRVDAMRHMGPKYSVGDEEPKAE